MYNSHPNGESSPNDENMKDLFSEEITQEPTDVQSAWESVLKRMRPDLPSAWFERFIRPLNPVSCSNGVVQLNVPGRFVMEWVKERYLGTIQSLLSDDLGNHVVVELVTQLQEKKSSASAVSASVPITPMV